MLRASPKDRFTKEPSLPSVTLRHAPPLPIDAVLPDVMAALQQHRSAVVIAPPGAGKTTRLPLALLNTRWLGDGKILVLEPRRLAARAAAQQMSHLLGEAVGGTVGYRVRLERRISARTRIEVVTEGILTRMIQSDPSLDGVAAICFDEFHERHLTTDLGLALALQSRSILREDLRIVVMSATLEAAPVARLLGDAGRDAPVIVSEGRAFAVETRMQPPRDGTPFALSVAQAIAAAWNSTAGDMLVFLPGLAELHRVRGALDERARSESALATAEIVLLHGSLSLADQDRVLRSSTTARRIVLSTAIAESSVTLDGVRVVVDAGLARVPRYSPRSGMMRLDTVRVSRASADQRRGRAGRTAPGVCVRLWDEATDAQLAPRTVPEILDADLTPLALELACSGIADATDLRWLDLPPSGALAQGRGLLRDLGALDATGRVTAHGRAMAELGIAPRLAHLAITGAAQGSATLACEVAALLAERDILRREVSEHDADLRTRVEALRSRAGGDQVDRARVERVRQEARALRAALRNLPQEDDTDISVTGALVALAYPDRVAKRRDGAAPRYLLRNGRGARLQVPQALGNAPFLAIADLDGDPAESRIWSAAPLSADELRAAVGEALVTTREVTWDASREAVRAVEIERVGALILRERPVRNVTDDEVADVLLAIVRERGTDALPWTDGARALRARLAFAHLQAPTEFADASDATLMADLEQWLRPVIIGMRRLSDLARADLAGALLGRIDWKARSQLDTIAPTHLDVPSGSRIAVSYEDPAHPTVAVRLQEVFGLTETPRIANGRIPLTIRLLSPAGRPVQVTRDLASFWRTTYFEVRRDLKGRYPRHHWPDDPLTARATRRVKPRGT